MIKALIDTDVLLDFFFDRKPFSDAASEVLRLCKEGQMEGFITPVIVANTYYLLRKTAKHEFVVDKLNQLLGFVNITIINKNIVLKALNSVFKDFEDALQHFSAYEHEEIKLILTRNIKDFKNSQLAVLTPETYIKSRGQE